MHSRMRSKYRPTINGKEVDLDLLYQIVTSHGGWEKVNVRNEWDDLLEHFHLPRGANGGFIIKQIYLKYLETYEKIYFLGEDGGAKDEMEDEYDDIRNRRRTASKITSRSSLSQTPGTASQQSQQQQNNVPISDSMREQFGLSPRTASDYDRLLLSLKSPLPNEQDMAISVCTLLSNETKHVLKFDKCPAILNLLLAHMGIYEDCGLRMIMEEAYTEARNMNLSEFWDEVAIHPETRPLLCESYVDRIQTGMGLTDGEDDGDGVGNEMEMMGRINDNDTDLEHLEQEEPEPEPEPEPHFLEPEEGKEQEVEDMEVEMGKEKEKMKEEEKGLVRETTPEPEEPEPAPKEEGEEILTPRTEKERKVEALKGELSKVKLAMEEVINTSPSKFIPPDTEDTHKNTLSKEEDELEESESQIEKKEPLEMEMQTEGETKEESPEVDSRSPLLEKVETKQEIETELDESKSKESVEKQERANVAEAEKIEKVFEPLVEEQENRNINIDLEPAFCCSICPCRKKPEDEGEGEIPSIPPTLTRSLGSDDKVGQRIHQIAFILRNLSFEEENASVMAKNPALLRYLLIAANCSYGTLPQLSFDIFGNIAGHIKLQNPHKDPITSMLLSLVTSGLFSVDRFKVLASLEAIRDLTKTEQNEKIMERFMEKKIYKRLCELLTLCDIMLLIYTLECILSITGIGETVCDELVRIKGSVATLVSLVTVEAQSYGPKGCILMRVVETVTGGSSSNSSSTGSTASPVQQALATPSTSTLTPLKTLPQTPLSVSPAGVAKSIQAIGLRTVSGQTIVPPIPNPNGLNLPQGQGQGPFAGISLSGLSATLAADFPGSQSIQNIRPLVRVQPPNPIATSTSISPLSSPIQVQVARGSGAVSPSPLGVLPALMSGRLPNPALTQVAQMSMSATPVKTTSNSNPNSNVNINATATATSASSTFNPCLNNVNHVKSAGSSGCGAGAGTVGGGGVAQVSSHSLTQQVYTPPIGQAAAGQKESLTEEAWASAWLTGGFEASGGTSIEEGELYRMYCAARQKPLAALLSQDQLVQCVKLVYGASVGPVMKSFGSTSLSFIEGIRPKINLRPTVAVGAAGTEGLSTPTPNPTNSNSTVNINLNPNSHTNTNTSNDLYSTSTSATNQNGLSAHNSSNNTAAVPRPITPVQLQHQSVHIPSPLSPILKATLSRPPTPKTTSTTGTADKNNSMKGKKLSVKTKKKLRKESHQSKQHGAKLLSPSSSAIRSLLASKVAQRQQKKMQQETKSKKGDKSKPKGPVKMNGVGLDSSVAQKGEESSASSSLNSIEEDSSTPKTDPSSLTFEGVLCNGSGDPSKIEEHMDVDDLLDDLTKNSKVKGMLVDLLERKVAPHKDVNGIVGREIRISDKGLELVDKSSNSSLGGTILGNSDSQEPQQMTFYASTPEVVVPSGQNSCNVDVEVSPTPETVLLSGGGVGGGGGKAQIVRISKLEQPLENQNQNPTLTLSGSGAGNGGGDGNNASISNIANANNSNSADLGLGLGVNFAVGSNSNGSANGPGSGSSASASPSCDLLEKFNQFSDLIVVNPEQLGIGLKRPSSALSLSDSDKDQQTQAPPAKKPTMTSSSSHVNVNGTDNPSISISSSTSISTGSSVLQAALSLTQTASTTPASTSNTSTNTNNLPLTTDAKVTIPATATTNSQILQQMVRIVNPQNASQQLTFTPGRQMVLQAGGHQVLLSTGGSQPGMGQVIISKPTGASGDLAKAIILIPAPAQNTNTNTNHPQGQPQIALVQGPSQIQMNQSAAVSAVHAVLNQLVNKRDGVPPNMLSHIPLDVLEEELPFLCEWSGCGYRFCKPQQVFMHAIAAHCPDPSSTEAVRCEWSVNGCDPLLRKRYSVMTHLQDRHCNKQALDNACYRRKNKIADIISEAPPAPQQPTHHPGYAPNAAFHAIKRHALQFMNPKEVLDENEGPVTKSIRLTSALILRNLVNYSPLGRRMIGAYESQLSAVAMSNVESSRTIAQLLHDMSESTSSPNS